MTQFMLVKRIATLLLGEMAMTGIAGTDKGMLEILPHSNFELLGINGA